MPSSAVHSACRAALPPNGTEYQWVVGEDEDDSTSANRDIENAYPSKRHLTLGTKHSALQFCTCSPAPTPTSPLAPRAASYES